MIGITNFPNGSTPKPSKWLHHSVVSPQTVTYRILLCIQNGPSSILVRDTAKPQPHNQREVMNIRFLESVLAVQSIGKVFFYFVFIIAIGKTVFDQNKISQHKYR